MIKAEVRKEKGGLNVEVECEGMMHEIMSETTHIINSIARSMEEKKEGSGRGYIQGLKIGMMIGLFNADPLVDQKAESCQKGPEGEPGVAGG